MTRTLKLLPLALLLASALAGQTRAGYVVNVIESGGDVVATGSGLVNTTDLSVYFISNTVFSRIGSLFNQVIIGGPAISTSSGNYVNIYRFIESPSMFFGHGFGRYADMSSGDVVGVDGSLGLILPEAYVSGSSLSSDAFWRGQTFASLGLIPGTYTWTWGGGANADFFTMNIGVASVPEPSTIGAALLGAVGIVVSIRRRIGRAA